MDLLKPTNGGVAHEGDELASKGEDAAFAVPSCPGRSLGRIGLDGLKKDRRILQ